MIFDDIQSTLAWELIQRMKELNWECFRVNWISCIGCVAVSSWAFLVKQPLTFSFCSSSSSPPPPYFYQCDLLPNIPPLPPFLLLLLLLLFILLSGESFSLFDLKELSPDRKWRRGLPPPISPQSGRLEEAGGGGGGSCLAWVSLHVTWFQ